MRVYILAFCFSLLAPHSPSYAQSCRDIKKWISKANEILPEEKNTVSLERDYVRVYAIAYHDDFFKPIFGKSYLQMSPDEKEHLYTKVNRCSSEGWVKYGLAKALKPEQRYINLWYSSIVGVNRMTVAQHAKFQQDRAAKLDRMLHPTPEDIRKRQESIALQRHINRVRAQEVAEKRAQARANVPVETLRLEAQQMERILRPIKNLNAPDYEFNGYNGSIFLKQIYRGEFTSLNISSLSQLFNSSLEETFERTRTLQKRADWLYSYLNYFSNQCTEKEPEKFIKFSPQYVYTDVDSNGRKSERTGKKETFYIKKQFYEGFKELHQNLAADQGMGFVTRIDRTDEIFTGMPADLKRLFTELGCDHPILQQLEANLYLAAKGKSPLQKLLPLMNLAGR